jgi:hypothetical protein
MAELPVHVSRGQMSTLNTIRHDADSLCSEMQAGEYMRAPNARTSADE